MPELTNISRRDPDKIRTMFDSIAPTYDILNRLLSFGMDVRWRRKAVSLLEPKSEGIFLDIAAGSGDVSLDILKLKPRRVVAADFAFRMLEVFQDKLRSNETPAPIDLVSCDAHALPFRDETFNGTIVAFGIRNFADRGKALREMLRVLKPGGRSVILELSQPTGVLPKFFYTVYSRIVLPAIGAVISRHNRAYSYLPQSIAEFPPAEEFVDLMKKAGFVDAAAQPMTFGSVTIFHGRKSDKTHVSREQRA
jgi:demethylmenaquinone methyltransferase / 2-methoxy-6-polyprenyl-1,4-benzoquinol methylase